MRALLILCAAALFAMPAAAAPVRGKPSEALALQAMRNFGRCVAETTPQGARKLLEMDFRSDEYGAAVERLAKGHGRCAPGSSMRFNAILFAGALAEAMFDAKVEPGDRAKVIAFDPERPAVEARSPTEAMALCLVLQHPQESAALLATDPASDKETAALKALAPFFGECLKKGAQAELNRPSIRSLVALAAWRVASASEAAR